MEVLSASRTVRSALGYLVLAIAIATYAASGYLMFLHLTQGPPSQQVNIRWSPSVSPAERVRAEREHGLADGVPFEGRTWRYFLRKRSHADIERLITDRRIEDTYHIDRDALRVQLDRPELSPRMRAWLESDWLGYVSIVLGCVAALMTWWLRRWLMDLGLRIIQFANRSIAWVETRPHRSTGEWRPPRWAVVLTVVWALIVIPYLAVGPPDMDEYFTGVVSTKAAMQALSHGAWPFWSLDFGIGSPQPLRYHFIFHPLAPLCLPADCQAVLRVIVVIHVLVGAVFMGLLALRFTGSRVLALVAALTYCMSSSVANFMFTDDWPLTVVHESAIPVMVYALLAIGDRKDRSQALMWSLVLGGTAGLIFSMTFPVVTLIIIACVALSTPGVRQRFPWLVLAAAVTLLMSAAKLHHIYTELLRTPPGIERSDHDEFPVALHLWSAFLRPLPLLTGQTWRTVFFGPPFAIAAALAATFVHDKSTRPLRVGLLLGVLGFVVPPAWLANINTAQWTYRAEVNIFGILLAVIGIDRWASAQRRPSPRTFILLAQLCFIAIAFSKVWYSVFAIATGLSPFPFTILRSPGIAEQVAEHEHASPGRVMFAPHAYNALREPLRFNSSGLAPNELPVLRVPTVSVVINGITADSLYPQSYLMESELKPNEISMHSRPLLDVLGVRYILAEDDDSVPHELREIQQWKNGLRLYENDTAWPEVFFVNALRNDPIPRLSDCGHSRFLCADFSQYDLHRRSDPLQITRLYDGFRLTFPPQNSPRHLLITQWYYPEWSVTAGRASVHRAAEQLIGIDVAPGERTVTVQYRPYLRAVLFALGIGTEIGVGLAIAVLALRNLRIIGSMETSPVQMSL